MTAPLLATRDALAKALFGINEPIGESWGDRFDPAQREVYLSMADALLASGVVRDPETLADDEALVERASARVHEAWMEAKRAQGVTSRPSESGEEQMVPYADLSHAAKSLDRSSVVAALTALAAALTEDSS